MMASYQFMILRSHHDVHPRHDEHEHAFRMFSFIFTLVCLLDLVHPVPLGRKMGNKDWKYGANMMLLTWDEELGSAALGFAVTLCSKDTFIYEAEACRMVDNYNSVGQNIFSTNGKLPNDANFAELAANAW